MAGIEPNIKCMKERGKQVLLFLDYVCANYDASENYKHPGHYEWVVWPVDSAGAWGNSAHILSP